MFPNVNAHQGREFASVGHEGGIILVGCAGDNKFSRLIRRQPGPARTKDPRRRGGQLRFKAAKITEILFDPLSQFARGFPAPPWGG